MKKTLSILSLFFCLHLLSQTPTNPIGLVNNLKITNPVQGSSSDSVLVWRGAGDKVVRYVPASFISGNIYNSVDNISSLQNYSGNATTITVKDTLRGGMFNYVESGLTADNGIVFTATGKGGGYWKRQYNNELYSEWYGAKGDSITNDYTALQNAINASDNLKVPLALKHKKYYTSTGLVKNSNTPLLGTIGNMYRDLAVSGRPFKNDGTILFTDSPTETLLTINAPATRIEDIIFQNTSVTAPTSGIGLSFTIAGEFKIERCGFFGFYQNCKVIDGRFWTINNCYFASPVSRNLIVDNQAAYADFGDNNITNTWFTNANDTTVNLEYTCSAGLKMTNVKFVSSGNSRAENHLLINPDVSFLSDVIINACSFEGFRGSAIKMQPQSGAYFLQDIQITNCQLAPYADVTADVIDIRGYSTAYGSNILVNNNSFFNYTGVNLPYYPIRIDYCRAVNVSGNVYRGWALRTNITNSQFVNDLSDYENIAKLNKSQTFTQQQTINELLRISSGQATGAIKIGGDVNAFTNTSNQRKLARITGTAYDSTSSTGMIASDNDGTNNYLDYGGSPSSVTHAATRHRWLVGSTTTTLGGTQVMHLFNTGNLLLQNGGTFTDDGVNRLQVSGSGIFTGVVKGATPTNTNDLTTKAYVDALVNSYVSKTANYTILSSDSVIDLTANSATITLPTAVGISGKRFTVKNSGSGTTLTLNTTSSQTIDGITSKLFNTQYSGCTVVSDGANWKIIAIF